MSSAKLFGFAINVEAEERGGGIGASSTTREVSPLNQRGTGDYRPYSRFLESNSHFGSVPMDVEPDLRDCFINFFDQASYEINTGNEFYVSPNQRVSTSGYFNIWEEDELELRLGVGSGSGSRSGSGSTMGQVRGDSGGVEVYSEIDSGHVEVGTVLTPIEDNFLGEATMVMNEASEWEDMLYEMSRVQEPPQVSGINVEEEEEELAGLGFNVDNMANSVLMDMGLSVYLANIDEDDDDIHRDPYAFVAQMFDENEAEIMGSPPASKSVVDDLPVVQREHQELSDENINCAICKDEILAEEKVRMLPCKHYFHGDCIIPWLKIRNTCPVCRYELPTDDLEYERNKILQRQRSSGLARDSMLE